MCGLVGVMNFSSTGISSNQVMMFQQMMHSGALRGMHGTGMFGVDEKGNLTRIRVGGPPHQLFGSPQWKDTEKFIKDRYMRMLIGHNRFATRGKHITEHAHPFRDGSVVMVHNGTLENYSWLPDHKKYEVDSELLCHAISKEGIRNIIPKLEGAWALIWWDGKIKKLHILRNDERPLHVAVHQSEKMVVIASEEEMLTWIMHRNGYFTFDMESVPEDTLYSFSLDKMEPELEALKGKPTSGKKWYYETSFVNTDDARATTCSSVQDAEIVNDGGLKGDWGKGKTGSVLQLPAPKSAGRHRAAGTKSSAADRQSWRPAHFLHDICKGDLVSCRIIDFDAPDDKAQDLFIVRCGMDEYPDIEFRCNVKGEDMMDKLYNAKYGLRASVFSIMKSDQPPAVNPHRIHLHNPEPADVWTKKENQTTVN